MYSVRGPRPEDVCAPVALGEAAIVRRGGDVTVIGYGRAIPDSLAGRSRALGNSSTERYFH
jgi:pyruvate/2-oxoglutarate/acetoin dehydrogenase E1 component